MADPDIQNLFAYAPKELSHSAFWAWVLNSLRHPRVSEYAGPQKIAKEMISKLTNGKFLPSVNHVITEQPLKYGAGRADIYVTNKAGQVLVIEMKINRAVSNKQLDRYKKSLDRTHGRRKGFVALVSAYFDSDALCSERYSVLDLEGQQGIIKPYLNSHEIVSEYGGWLNWKLEGAATRREKLNTGEFKDLREPLTDDVETQWMLMREIVQRSEKLIKRSPGIEYQSARYHGTSVGRPWVQYQFYEKYESNPYVIIYRLDSASRGPYLAVRDYKKHTKKNKTVRRERLDNLRDLWKNASSSTKHGLQHDSPRNRGKKEREIALYWIKDNQPSALIEDIPRIHRQFISELKRSGLFTPRS